MINADSILSMFTDRFTLLKYLQQLDGDVQKLLEKAVTSISVDKVPDTDDEYTLTINFEDGTSETTPAFVIEQGEDGRGIVSITKTDTTGNVDTYTITYTDGTTSTFTVTNGTPVYTHMITVEGDNFLPANCVICVRDFNPTPYTSNDNLVDIIRNAINIPYDTTSGNNYIFATMGIDIAVYAFYYNNDFFANKLQRGDADIISDVVS